MNKILLSIAAGLLALGGAAAHAAPGLSLADRAELARASRMDAALRLAGPSAPAKMRAAAKAMPGRYVSALVQLTDADALRESADDITVTPCRAGFAIVTMPREEVERVAAHPAVKMFSLSRPVAMKMDRARYVTGIDRIHTGDGLPATYTGRNVIAAVVDNGIDPNHINFLFPDGTPRVSMLSEATVDRMGNPITNIYNAETVRDFTTDDVTTFHGTHTLGIMAGSYDGAGIMAYKGTDGEYYLDENCGRTPFYGVAPAADLAVGAGASADVHIVNNIENILNYAAFMGNRVVINLSLGSNLGPHDGSAALNRYLDYISLDGEYELDGQTFKGDNAIICISAGNEGDLPIALNHTLSSADPEARTFLIAMGADEGMDQAGIKNPRWGHMYVYGNDERPFRVQLVAWNNKRNRAAWTKTLTEASGTLDYYCSGEAYVQESSDVIDPVFGNFFEGTVGIGTDVDEISGRYFAVLDIAAIDNISASNPDEDYSLGLIFTYIANDGKPQRIEAYSDANSMLGMGSLGRPDWLAPDGNGTISDMACGYNQIVVGCYNTKDSWVSLDGNAYGYGGGEIPENEVSDFSAFGTLVDGRTLPHVLAPGATIVSSSSYYYAASPENVYDDFNPMHPSARQGEVTFAGRPHYWMQMAGTSMSTPVVAGTIALWLEADPTLNVDDVRDIIEKTSVKDEFTAQATDPVKVGAGKLDGYAGLKEVLRRASLSDVAAAPVADNMLVRPVGERRYEVALPGASELNAVMCDAVGRVVARASASADEVVIDASSAAPGVYIISANGLAAKKITVK